MWQPKRMMFLQEIIEGLCFIAWGATWRPGSTGKCRIGSEESPHCSVLELPLSYVWKDGLVLEMSLDQLFHDIL